MNIQQIQFNRQKVAALLLAGSIIGATAGLTFVQPTHVEQPWSQPGTIAGSKVGSGTDGVSFKDGESGLSSESQFRLIAGRKPGQGMGNGGAG